MHNPGKYHRDAKWIRRYVKGSLGKCLVFDKFKSTSSDVVGFVDSDYGGDLGRRRSISGYILHFVRVLSLGKLPYSLLQLYLQLKPSM